MRSTNPESGATNLWIPGLRQAAHPGMTGLALFLRRGAEALFLFAQFGRQRLAEILRIEDLPDFDLGAAVERRALHPFDRLVARLHLDQPEAGDELAGCRKRT